MQNLYPLFERNRILKKELLWSLRDYSFAHIQLEYQEYGEGIIEGCDVRVEEGQLVVKPGIIKFGDFICLLTEEERAEYEPSEQLVVLKMRIKRDCSSPDHILYQMELIPDRDPILRENEFEVCRYKLQKGARLRSWHTDFEDMDTEFDTLNYIYASWGGLQGKAMPPVITRRFAEEILKAGNCLPEDILFAYFCLNQSGALPERILTDYVERKNHKDLAGIGSNYELFSEMCLALRNIKQNGTEERRNQTGRRKIIVD